MKVDYGYNFIRITCVEADISDNKITFPEDPIFGKYPIIVYCEDTGTLYTGAYDDGDVTLSEYGSGSGGGGGGSVSDIVYVPISVDYSGGDPVVSCETAPSTIFADLSAGKIVVLVQPGTYYYYPMDFNISESYCNWYCLGSNPSFTKIGVEGTEWGYDYFSLQPRG